jgi:hypothetical protein
MIISLADYGKNIHDTQESLNKYNEEKYTRVGKPIPKEEVLRRTKDDIIEYFINLKDYYMAEYAKIEAEINELDKLKEKYKKSSHSSKVPCGGAGRACVEESKSNSDIELFSGLIGREKEISKEVYSLINNREESYKEIAKLNITDKDEMELKMYLELLIENWNEKLIILQDELYDISSKIKKMRESIIPKIYDMIENLNGEKKGLQSLIESKRTQIDQLQFDKFMMSDNIKNLEKTFKKSDKIYTEYKDEETRLSSLIKSETTILEKLELKNIYIAEEINKLNELVRNSSLFEKKYLKYKNKYLKLKLKMKMKMK